MENNFRQVLFALCSVVVCTSAFHGTGEKDKRDLRDHHSVIDFPELLPAVKGPLEKKVSHFYWSPDVHAYQSGIGPPDILLAPIIYGGFVAAWKDSVEDSHFQFFSDEGMPIGNSICIHGMHIHAITADYAGFAGLFSDENKLTPDKPTAAYLIGFDTNGWQRFKRKVVGGKDMKDEGARCFDEDHSNSQLAYSNGYYTMYFSIFRNFGADGIHQGDVLMFSDMNGNIVCNSENKPEGISWGVSHSFTKNFYLDNEAWQLFTVGDAYPRGVSWSSYSRDPLSDSLVYVEPINLWPIPGKTGDNYVFGTSMTDCASLNKKATGLFLSYLWNPLNPEKAEDYKKLFYVVVDEEGNSMPAKLADSEPGRYEGGARIIPWNKHLLVSWTSKLDFNAGTEKEVAKSFEDRYALLDENGNLTAGPYLLPTGFGSDQAKAGGSGYLIWDSYSGSEFIQLHNGELIWARHFYKENRVEFVRIKK